MRGVVGALVVLATAAVGVPAASAGAYDVAACNARAATAVNNRGAGQSRSFPSARPRRRMIRPPTTSPATVPDLTAARGAARTPAMRRFAGGRARTARSRRLPTRASRGSRLWRYGGRVRAGRGQCRAAPTRRVLGASRETRRATVGADALSARAMPSGRRLRTRTRCTIGAPGFSDASKIVHDGRATSFKIGIFCGGDNGRLHRAATRTTDQAARTASSRSPGVRWCTSTDTDRTGAHGGGRADQLGLAEGQRLRSPTTPRTTSAIRAVRLDVDGRVLTPRQKRACDYHLTAALRRPASAASASTPCRHRPTARTTSHASSAEDAARQRAGPCAHGAESTARRRPPSSSAHGARRSCSR